MRWHVKPFLQKNISLRYLSCIEYFFDQIFFVGKFGTNAGSATWWSKLEPIERWIFLSIEFACFVAGLSYFFKQGLLFCVNHFLCTFLSKLRFLSTSLSPFLSTFLSTFLSKSLFCALFWVKSLFWVTFLSEFYFFRHFFEDSAFLSLFLSE